MVDMYTKHELKTAAFWEWLSYYSQDACMRRTFFFCLYPKKDSEVS